MKILISTLFFTLAVSIKLGGAMIPVDVLDAAGNRGPPDLEFNFMSHKISLWADNTRTRVTHAGFEGNFVPDDDYYKEQNYLIRLVNVRGLRFIAYIKQDGSLLGVEPMYPEKSAVNDPEPNEATWFIVYGRRYFRLIVDPVNGTLKEMHLIGENSPHIGLAPEPVEVADIRFFVFKNACGRIIAASLIPYYYNP